MGGICSRSWKGTVDGVVVDNALDGSSRNANGHANQSMSGNINSNSTLPPLDDESYKHQRESFSFTGLDKVSYGLDDINDGIPHLARTVSQKSKPTKSKNAAVKLSCHSHLDLSISCAFGFVAYFIVAKCMIKMLQIETSS